MYVHFNHLVFKKFSLNKPVNISIGDRVFEKMTKNMFFMPVFSQDFPDFLIFIFTNLPLPQNVLESGEVATQGKKGSSLYYVQTSSFLFVGMWRVCKSSKMKHPGGSGKLYPQHQRETQAR